MDERDGGGGDGGFERRLQEARARKGLDKAPGGGGAASGGGGGGPGGGLPAGSLGIGFRAGVEVVAALGVGVVIGLLLDRWLGTRPWLFLLFFVAGAAAGMLNVYRLFDPRSGRRV